MDLAMPEMRPCCLLFFVHCIYDPKRMRITCYIRWSQTYREYISRSCGIPLWRIFDFEKCLSIRFVNQRRRKPASGCDKLEKHDVLPEYYRDGNIFPKESISLLPRNRTGQISLGRWILRTVMNHVDAITVRDSESKFFFLEQLGVKNRIYYTADAVLSLSRYRMI